MNYCQDGIHATEAQQYSSIPIYGHYALQPNDVNDRPYFKNDEFGLSLGLWWDGIGFWWIGYDGDKGQKLGFAYNVKDVFCPHQLSELDWWVWDGNLWSTEGNDVILTCKCIFIQN